MGRQCGGGLAVMRQLRERERGEMIKVERERERGNILIG